MGTWWWHRPRRRGPACRSRLLRPCSAPPTPSTVPIASRCSDSAWPPSRPACPRRPPPRHWDTTSTTTTTTSATTTTATTTTITVPSPSSTAIGAGPGAAPATSSTTSATTAPPPSTTLPLYESRLAWVGIAWGADCPVRAGGTRLATRYVAVVIDAKTGRSVVAYTSRSPLACTGPVLPPSVTAPAELVSVPWAPLGPSSTSVRVTLPACGTYFGWTEVPGTGVATVQVVARKPFDPDLWVSCGPHPDRGRGRSTGQCASPGPTRQARSGPSLRTLPGG